MPANLLRQVCDLFGECEAHTPYGMTEALPVCDVTLDEIERAGTGNGVLVGAPLPVVQVSVSPLSPSGEADSALVDTPWLTGEILCSGSSREGPLRPVVGLPTRKRPRLRLAPNR